MLERAVRQATAAAARRERQQTLLQTQALYAQLSQMPRLLELPESAQPHDFPLPPAGSDREVAARQAHALALSEARVGSKWWAQLKALNRGAEKGRLDDDDAERWAGMDQAWRRQWEQVTRTEEARQGEPVGYIRRPSLFPPQAGSSGHDEPATGTSQTSAGAAAAGGRQAAAADTSAAVEAAVAAIDPLAIRALAAKLSPEAAALMMGSEQDGGPNGS